MKTLVYTLLLSTLFLSCSNDSKSFETNSDDYNSYLNTIETPEKTSKYYELWNGKIKTDSVQMMALANVGGEYTRFFKNSGEIKQLKKAEKAFTKALEVANVNKASYARALARNYISQHRFKEALQLADIANAENQGKKETQSLYFDIHMELGNYDIAEKYLEELKNFSDFGYLIRLAKWNDYKGNLGTTILMMEKAMAKAESANNKSLKLWSYTNIADYYGHAGRLKDSYKHYLKALQLDPNNAYAKKGIAWIVFSHEKNGEEALRILDAVTTSYHAPDYYLLKAEIASFMGESSLYHKSMKLFYTTSQDSAYGHMYNNYHFDYFLDYDEQMDKALDLAKTEVENRATPESYAMLAVAYLKIGQKEKAKSLIENYVVGKTYEPGILLSVAQVYKATNQFDKVDALKQELIGAVYELGPASRKEIEQL